jgi:hypothetical protein
MKNELVVPEDIDVLLRRGELSSEQRNAFERKLKEVPLSELAYRVGVAFDRIADVRGGDEERVRRCVERALQTQLVTQAPRRRGLALWLSAALVLITTSGVAWWSQKGITRHHTPTLFMTWAIKPDFARIRTPAVTSDVPRIARSDVEPNTISAEATSPPAIPTNVPNVQTDSRSEGTPWQPPSASELLSRANAARGKGWFTEASELYRQLQREYPHSAETKLSRISLGRIGLLRGQAGTALLEFEEYLKSKGPLDEEALIGKAHALGALGRTDEQQATYSELLRRFPSSVYAAEAHLHLGMDLGEP